MQAAASIEQPETPEPPQIRIEGIAAAVELNNHFLQIHQNMKMKTSSQADDERNEEIVNQELVSSDSDSDVDEYDQAIEQEE
jgi:hypothetical protein